MSNKLTPEQIEEHFKKYSKSFSKFQQASQADQERWVREIENLEKRVVEETTDIDLGNGTTIALRTALSEREMRTLGDLEKRRVELTQKKNRTAKEVEAANRLMFEELEIITANPLLTAKWFEDNPEKYAQTDILTVVLGYYENQASQKIAAIARVRQAASFRTDPGRPELRGLPEVPGDQGPR